MGILALLGKGGAGAGLGGAVLGSILASKNEVKKVTFYQDFF